MSNSALQEMASQYTVKAKRWYWALPPRDRMVVNGVGFFVVFAMVYMMIWSPLKLSADQAMLKWQNKQAVVDWIQANQSIATAANSGNKAATNIDQRKGQSLLTLVNTSAQRNNIALKRFEPDGDDKLRVWLENVSFNSAIGWLNSLKNEFGINVSNISIETHGQMGVVDVKIVFKG